MEARRARAPWLCARCGTLFASLRETCPTDGGRVVANDVGRLIGGRYRLEHVIGVGGMNAAVWRAWETKMQRAVAVKLLPVSDNLTADRFVRGAHIGSNLSHPNITVVHDFGRTGDDKLFLVMELLDGVELSRVIHQMGPLPIPRVINITNQILKALTHAHRHNVVHRDLKPGNLFLTNPEDGEDLVKVLDFGIAKVFAEGAEADALTEIAGQELTGVADICGTPQYMSPEQILKLPVDARSDLYSLGVVIYRMLTGQLPFYGQRAVEQFRGHVREPPPPMRPRRTEIPQSVEDFVLKALSKDPAARYPSAVAMRRALIGIRREMVLTMGDESLAGGSLDGTLSFGPSGSVDVEVPPPRPASGALPAIARAARMQWPYVALPAAAALLLMLAWWWLTRGVGA